MADTQKKQAYHAEWRLRRWLDQGDTVSVFGSTWVPEPEVKFGDVASVQRYVDRVLAYVPGKQPPVTVRERRGQTKAHYERCGHVIALPPHHIGGSWALRETVVLHELAHHLSRTATEGHGPEFAREFVRLHEVLGYPIRAMLLTIALAEEGIAI
jgi:putative metallohydrolase (TIGR04338 family)